MYLLIGKYLKVLVFDPLFESKPVYRYGPMSIYPMSAKSSGVVLLGLVTAAQSGSIYSQTYIYILSPIISHE